MCNTPIRIRLPYNVIQCGSGPESRDRPQTRTAPMCAMCAMTPEVRHASHATPPLPALLTALATAPGTRTRPVRTPRTAALSDFVHGFSTSHHTTIAVHADESHARLSARERSHAHLTRCTDHRTGHSSPQAQPPPQTPNCTAAAFCTRSLRFERSAGLHMWSTRLSSCRGAKTWPVSQ